MTLRLTIALLMILSFSAASIADVTLPSYPKGKGKYCVEPTDVMRRDHFEYLMHHRQISVHLGVRTKIVWWVASTAMHPRQMMGPISR